MSNEATPVKAAEASAATVESATERVVEFKVGDEDVRLTMSMVRDLLTRPTKAGRKPAAQDVVKFMMLLKAQRLNPWEDDCYLIGYDNRDGGSDWSMITSAGAYLKRADTHATYDGMESGIIVRAIVGKGEPAADIDYREGCCFSPEAESLLGGWARVWRSDRTRPTFKALTVASRRKPSPFWNLDNTHNQICKCAEVAALRAAFPTIIGSMLSHEEHGRRMQTIDGESVSGSSAKPPPAQIPEIATSAEPEPEPKPAPQPDPQPEPEPEPEPQPQPKPKPKPKRRSVESGDFARRADLIEAIEGVRKFKNVSFMRALSDLSLTEEKWDESEIDEIEMIAAALKVKAAEKRA
tara:strand:- start:5241 stop:6296 length:1056 start_codon:yes stop_codon:yes gene_type:complete